MSFFLTHTFICLPLFNLPACHCCWFVCRVSSLNQFLLNQFLLVDVGFGNEIVANKFSFCVCTNTKRISASRTPNKLIPLPRSISWPPQDSLDAQGLTSRTPAFSIIREVDFDFGGIERIFGVRFGAERSLCVWINRLCARHVIDKTFQNWGNVFNQI